MSGISGEPGSGESFLVLAEYRPLPGEEQRVLELLGSLAAESRAEPGNLGYRFHVDAEDPGRILIAETYTGPDAFAAHRGSAHFRSIGREQILPLLADRTVTAYTGPVAI